MRATQPKVYCVAATTLQPGIHEYLNDIGDPEWSVDSTIEDCDNLTEFGGRLCYRAWQPWDPMKPDCSNENVSKVREGNDIYIANLIKQNHGSVLEHANLTILFRDVSRVFTHELVRHRAGMGYSQESLRYVRLSDIKFFIPPSVAKLDAKLEEGSTQVHDLFESTVIYLEAIQRDLARIADMDDLNFNEKKQLTSLFRRLAPLGLATTIMATGNMRAWRHIANMRSGAVAEEEMQIVMPQLVSILLEYAPNCCQDFVVDDETGMLLKMGHPKI